MSKIKNYAEEKYGGNWADKIQDINQGERVNGKRKRQTEDC